MTTYKEIFGKPVKVVSSDPANEAEGQIWYNSTLGSFRSVVASGAWSSAAPTSSNLFRRASAGTATSAFLAAGDTGSTPSIANTTEEWNGSGFSSGGNVNTARYSAAASGNETAGLMFGGFVPPYSNATESYNGSSWTTSPYTLNTARFVTMGCGTSTAALCFGGLKSPSNALSADSEEYDGEGWTSGNSMNTARESTGQAGIQTAALAFGGYTTTYSAATEAYNGTSWTNVNSMNTARFSLGGAGTQTSAVAYGGNTGSMSAATETWDGSSWTTSPVSLATARYHMGDFGSSTNAFAAGGSTPTAQTITEEYNFTANTVTAGAWASGGNLNTGRTALGGTGITTAAIAMGGGAPLNVQTEEYNGSSWTSTNNINVGRAIYGGAFGPQGAAGAASGEPTSSPAGTAYEEYDGSSWTNGPTLNIGRNGGISLGTQTAALCVAGFTGPAAPNSYIKTSESWNGSSWTSLPSPGSDTQTAGQGSGAGTTTAGLIFGRYDGAPNYTNKTDEYDGSSWTVGGVMITARYSVAGSGAQTAAMASSGYNTGALSIVEGYDGNSWSTRPSVGSGDRYQVAGAGASNTDCIQFGGSGNSTATEEFTGDTTSLNYKNISSS